MSSNDFKAAEASQSTALALPERAALAIGSSKREIELVTLVTEAKTIERITSADGDKEANATRIKLKNARTSITAASKLARDDATAFSKACIAEEKRLIGIVEPEEVRIKKLQDDWEEALEAERQRLLKIEAERLQGIKDGIARLQRFPLEAVGKDAASIAALITSCECTGVDEATYAEHFAIAAMAKVDALTALKTIHAAAVSAEAEAERVRLERIELEALREQNQRNEEARLEQQRIKDEADAELRRVARAKEEREAVEAQADVARLRAESERLSNELAQLRRANEVGPSIPEECLASANSEAQIAAAHDDEERHAQRINPPTLVNVAPVPDDQAIDRPTDSEIIAVLADHFDVSPDTAFEWIMQINLFPDVSIAA